MATGARLRPKWSRGLMAFVSVNCRADLVQSRQKLIRSKHQIKNQSRCVAVSLRCMSPVMALHDQTLLFNFLIAIGGIADIGRR